MAQINYEAKTSAYKEVVESELQRLTTRSDIPTNLLSAMRYSLLAGGKRLRACLVLGAWELFGGDFSSHEEQKRALPLACSMEMIHAYSLIHDDLPCMDDDDFRRGKPSCHKVYGEAIALLAGDGLLSLAFETLIGADIRYGRELPGYSKAIFHIARGAGCSGMICGQVLDMLSETEENRTMEQLKRIHSGKTGGLITASVLAGAYAGTRLPDAHEEAAIAQFSESYGLLFQITDDILDVTGDKAVLGKSTGKDEKSGKLTYPSLIGLDASRAAAREAAENAKDAMAIFGESGEYFRALVDRTVSRDR